LNALTYALHFWYAAGTSSKYLYCGQVPTSCGQGQDHVNITIHTFVAGLPLTERRSC